VVGFVNQGGENGGLGVFFVRGRETSWAAITGKERDNPFLRGGCSGGW